MELRLSKMSIFEKSIHRIVNETNMFRLFYFCFAEMGFIFPACPFPRLCLLQKCIDPLQLLFQPLHMPLPPFLVIPHRPLKRLLHLLHPLVVVELPVLRYQPLYLLLYLFALLFKVRYGCGSFLRRV